MSTSFEMIETNLRKVIDKNADSIVVVDHAGQILYLNSASREMFDRSSHFGIGETFGFPLTVGEATELDIHRRNNERLVVEMRVVNIDWDGQDAYLASMREITQRKIIEELLELKVKERTIELQKINDELARMYEDASKAAQLRTQFIANVSHEVRTPLAGIVTSAELMQTAEGEEFKELTSILLSSSKQLLQLVEAILDFSKLEAGKVSVTRSMFDIRELVDYAMESLFLSAKKKSIELSADFDSAVPATIPGDALKVRQVLMNLVNNSIKFTLEGSVTVKVTAIEEDDVSFLKISVKDSGIGMSAAECTTIFQPFVQANKSIQPSYGGTGLGLSICKELVNAIGGNIGFCSEQSIGSTFWFTFPIGQKS
jgi:two-component system, sensor histidine kinase and response regulator